MGRLWTPPKVSRELREGTAEHTAELMLMLEDAGPMEAEWNRELHKIDPLLMLVKAKASAHSPGLLPGFWHLLRLNPGTVPLLLPISNPDGSPAEPSHRTLSWLRTVDLQSPRALRAREEEMARRLESGKRAEQTEKEGILEEVEERWAAASRTQVSMNPDRPWTQNNSPAARRDAGDRVKQEA